MESISDLSHVMILLIYLFAVKFINLVDNNLRMHLCLVVIQDIHCVLVRYIPSINIYWFPVLFSGLLPSVKHVTWSVQEVLGVACISRNLEMAALFDVFDTSHAIDASWEQEWVVWSIVADRKPSSWHKILILLLITLLQSVGGLAVLICINHYPSHELTCHHWSDALLLHLLTLRCLIDLIWHWRYFEYHGLPLNKLMLSFIICLHLSVFKILAFLAALFALIRILLQDFLRWIVEAPLSSFVRICHILAIDLVKHAVRLFHCKIDLDIVKNVIDSSPVVMIAVNLLLTITSTMILQSQIYWVLFTDWLTMIQVGNWGDYQRLWAV